MTGISGGMLPAGYDGVHAKVKGSGTVASGQSGTLIFEWGGTGPYDVTIACTDGEFWHNNKTTMTKYDMTFAKKTNKFSRTNKCKITVHSTYGNASADGYITWLGTAGLEKAETTE